MNIAPFIFVGLLATFSFSWFGYVFKSAAELGRLQPFVDPITSAVYPNQRSGQEMQGAEVYRAQGCAACHTQQVRAASEGNDLSRGWGIRRTVATDYMLENPPQLGKVRLGPDLSNVGLRKTTNDLVWHYQHLLDPKSVTDKSNMPPYPYLFTKVKNGTPGSFTIPTQPKDAYVPNDEAKALVAYLVSLKNTGSVFEAPRPMPKAQAKAPAGGTNAPAANTTNAPAK